MENVIATLTTQSQFIIFTDIRLIILDDASQLEREGLFKDACYFQHDERALPLSSRSDNVPPDISKILKYYSSYREILYYRIVELKIESTEKSGDNSSDIWLNINYIGQASGRRLSQKFPFNLKKRESLDSILSGLKSFIKRGKKQSQYLRINEKIFTNSLQKWGVIFATFACDLITVPYVESRIRGLIFGLFGVLAYIVLEPIIYLIFAIPLLCDGFFWLTYKVINPYYYILACVGFLIAYRLVIFCMGTFPISFIFPPFSRRRTCFKFISLIIIVGIAWFIYPYYSDSPTPIIGLIEIFIGFSFVSWFLSYKGAFDFQQNENPENISTVPRRATMGILSLIFSLFSLLLITYMVLEFIVPYYSLKDFDLETWRQLRLERRISPVYYESSYILAGLGMTFGIATMLSNRKGKLLGIIGSLIGTLVVIFILLFSICFKFY